MRDLTVTHCRILYQDTHLLIVDKPSGVLSHPNPRAHDSGKSSPKGSAAAFEGHYDFDKRVFQTPQGPLWLMHRLDQEASGILIAAKDGDTAQAIRFLFESGGIRKMYVTLVSGLPPAAHGKWRDHLCVRKGKGFVRSKILASGRPNAELKYHVAVSFRRHRLSLLEILLVTGRTHQIRVQAAYHGCPVAGDDVYGDFALNRRLRKTLGLKRLFLHAYEVEFNHPVTGQVLHIESSLPEALEACLECAAAGNFRR